MTGFNQRREARLAALSTLKARVLLGALASLCAAACVACLACADMSSQRLQGGLAGMKSFEQSELFADLVQGNLDEYTHVAWLRQEGVFETDGQLDLEKSIDLASYAGLGEQGLEAGALTYRLSELLSASRQVQSSGMNYETVLVLSSEPAGLSAQSSGIMTYRYVTEAEFSRLYDGDYTMVNFANTTGSLVVDGRVYYGFSVLSIPSSDSVPAPEQAESILALANDEASPLNGKLGLYASAFDALVSRVASDYESCQGACLSSNAGDVFLALDRAQQRVLCCSDSTVKTYEQACALWDELAASASDATLSALWTGATLQLDFAGQNATAESVVKEALLQEGFKGMDVAYVVPAQIDAQSQIGLAEANYERQAVFYRGAIVAIPLLGLVFLVAFILFTLGQIRLARGVRDNVALLPAFDRVPTELAALLGLLGAFVWINVAGRFSYAWFGGSLYAESVAWRFAIYLADAACVFCVGLGCMLLFMFCWGSLIRRMRMHTLWKNALAFRLVDALRGVSAELFAMGAEKGAARHYGVRLLAVLLANVVLAFLLVCLAEDRFDYSYGLTIVLLVLVFVLLIVLDARYLRVFAKRVRELCALSKALDKISEGAVDYRVDPLGFEFDTAHMAVSLNRIGEGLHGAVDQAVKSERLKTDLIANVSHDIKTPLTSVITYVDLLGKLDLSCENDRQKASEYLTVLEKKANRLKTLTEDVVEASRISSGNVHIAKAPLDLTEMMREVQGEFSDKYAARDLDLVTKLPDGPVFVSSDGRALWRILSNIYGNAAKYAQEGTRVYASLVANADGTATLELKNTSQAPLDIPAEELMERFVRGDLSRSTEGSGLGLSIARSLAELLDVAFSISIDGDLFKVELVFSDCTVDQA